MTPKEYIEGVLKTESVDFEAIAERLQPEDTIRLLHAVEGIVTEAGELMDMMKKHIFYGNPLDLVNVVEELGDLSWYMALAIAVLQAMGVETSFEDIWGRNNAKLNKVRYKDGFKAEDALNRDLDAEREVLEEKTVSYQEDIYLTKLGEKDGMKTWFLERYESPAENCPFESAEGGYQFFGNGPYDAKDVLIGQFGGQYSDEAIEEIGDELGKHLPEWASKPSDDDNSNDIDEDAIAEDDAIERAEEIARGEPQ
jgi:hypothetical protein